MTEHLHFLIIIPNKENTDLSLKMQEKSHEDLKIESILLPFAFLLGVLLLQRVLS